MRAGVGNLVLEHHSVERSSSLFIVII